MDPAKGSNTISPDATNRKLTTILAADVVGYSQLMAADEEATLSRLQTYRKVIDLLVAKHNGRIFNTAGDAVLAEFGSAVEAVRCAVSIQEDLAVRNAQLREGEQMWFRIGINVGDVMIEGGDLFGDGVNVAARLEGLAEKGGICISGSTFEQVKNKLSVAFSDIGPQTVKNIPEPVPAFRIVPGQVSVNADRPADAPQMPLGASKANNRRLLIAGLAGIVILTGAMLAWWALSIPAVSSYPFDGRWEVTVHSRSGCRSNERTTFPILVTQGAIDEPHHPNPKKGTVSADGAFRIEVSGRDGRPRATQEGMINGDVGEGQFLGARPGCTGSVAIKRFN
jgi:class 3 adenylate cyclase